MMISFHATLPSPGLGSRLWYGGTHRVTRALLPRLLHRAAVLFAEDTRKRATEDRHHHACDVIPGEVPAMLFLERCLRCSRTQSSIS